MKDYSKINNYNNIDYDDINYDTGSQKIKHTNNFKKEKSIDAKRDSYKRRKK